MPRTLSEKTLHRYQDALTLAHRKWEVEAKPIIETMAKYFSGDQWPARTVADTTGVDPLVVNFVFADVKVMLPSLALRTPRIFVHPTRATTIDPASGEPLQLVPGGPDGAPVPIPVVKAAQAKELLINWRWRELRLKQQIRRTLVDALLAPFGIVKLGYTVETEKVEAESGIELESHELIRKNAPFAVRWSPLDFRVDPEARYPDLSDASIIWFGYKARVDDLRRNKRFHNTRTLTGSVALKTDYGAMTGTAKAEIRGDAEDRLRVQVWEGWDKREGKRITLVDDHPVELEYVDWPLKHEGFPAETLYFTEYPETLYAPPDLYQILDQQNAYNELSAIILNHVKRFLRKYIYQRGAFTEKDLEQLKQPIDGLAVATDATDVEKAIAPLKDAAVPADWWTSRVTFRDDHDRLSGMGDFIRGTAEKVDTATEANLIQSNLSVRVNDARDLVEDFAQRISRQLLQIDAQTFDPQTLIPITGPDGALVLGQFFRMQSVEFLQAETDVEVEVGSMQPINQQRRKADAIGLYRLWNGDPAIDQLELRKKVATAFQDSLPDIERLVLTKERVAQITQRMQTMGAGAAPATITPGPGQIGMPPPGGVAMGGGGLSP